MKAVVYHKFGPPDVLQLDEVEKPRFEADEVLVRVRAASINPVDWYALYGRPYIGRPALGLLKPKTDRLGIDFAGIVETVGSEVTEFRPGDEVFGGSDGALAQYVSASGTVALKPANMTFEQAASVPIAALSALQGLRDIGKFQAGQKVLINGASGGVGTFAVQIAKALGAEVTGVCSTRNVDLARSLGADYVIDYTREDFTKSEQRYDLMLDIAGSRSWRDCRRVLTPQATLVIIGAPKGGRFLGPLSHMGKLKIWSSRSSQKVSFFIAKMTHDDLVVLRDLLEAGKVTPVIDKRYELDEVARAFRYLGEGHAQGKVIINVS